MGVWETLRTALDLSRRVQQIEQRQGELSERFEHLNTEWTDTLDLLRAREERQRKRDRTALKTALGEPRDDAGGGAPVVADAGSRKAQLRRKLLTGEIRPHVDAK